MNPANDDLKHWKEFLAKQVPQETRPVAYPIVLRHKPGCKSRKGQNPNCECPKWGQPKGGGGKARFPLYVVTWKDAADRIEQYLDARDKSKVREKQRDAEWDEIHHYSAKSFVEGFQEYIQYRTDTSRERRENETKNDTIRKIEKQRDDLLAFLEKYNAQNEPVTHFHQLTFELLQYKWRPEWPVNTPGTINDYRSRFASLIHFAQERHWMKDMRKNDHEGACQCIAHQIGTVNSRGDDNKKMPFNDLPEEHGGDPEWQMKFLYKACAKMNTETRLDLGIQLENFIRVMRYSGARIVDVALMKKCAVDALGIWTYQPLKTKYTTGVWLSVQLPPTVVRQLREMPAASSDYFFWTGDSTEQGAPNRWTAALAELWPLVDKAAGLEPFVDDRGHNRWGIRDAFTNELVAVSSHTFRNTFAVSGRIQGMSFARIAECIGDTEKIVKKHYSRYTRAVINAIARDVRETWPEADRREYDRLAAAVKQFDQAEVSHAAQA